MIVGLETALNTVQNNMRVTVNGGKVNLNTSEFWFNNPAGKFGVLHGPAAVSDVFTGKTGQFLLIIQPLELVTTTMLQDTFIRLTLMARRVALQ